jgi:hypothetical protein
LSTNTCYNQTFSNLDTYRGNWIQNQKWIDNQNRIYTRFHPANRSHVRVASSLKMNSHFSNNDATTRATSLHHIPLLLLIQRLLLLYCFVAIMNYCLQILHNSFRRTKYRLDIPPGNRTENIQPTTDTKLFDLPTRTSNNESWRNKNLLLSTQHLNETNQKHKAEKLPLIFITTRIPVYI